MNINSFGFEDLEIWKKARSLKIEISATIKSFPAEEKFRLADQILRSARSIGALIAEGHGRFSYPDQIHFCIQARGSLTETINHLIDALDANYISEIILEDYRIKFKELERMLNGYIIYLRSQKDLKTSKLA
ncbi:MAG: four helix bundle protein [Bacteroidota bacterium]|nr:four helix bundle protein [Bacteroidota bacterium]